MSSKAVSVALVKPIRLTEHLENSLQEVLVTHFGLISVETC